MSNLKKLLVVDDDPVIGKSFDRVLSAKGYAVVTARDGEEALRKIASEKYDAVFTDIRMPGMDGVTVAEQIKTNQPWLPVVIVSGYSTAEYEARAEAAGVFSILHKPLSPQMIEDSARDVFAAKVEEVAAPVVAEEVVKQPRTFAVWAKQVALFFVAPFIGLAYIIAMPFVLPAVALWAGYKAIYK